MGLEDNARAALWARYPGAIIDTRSNSITDSRTGATVKEVDTNISSDPNTGIKQKMLCIRNFGDSSEILSIASNVDTFFGDMDLITLEVKSPNQPHSISSNDMVYSPKLIIYTNKLHISLEKIDAAFSMFNIKVEIMDESQLHGSLFISYGGPDEDAAKIINQSLKGYGIKTWFFPDDSLPGQKLHRMMYDGVNDHDSVLLICSKDSLTRNGVMNEIERVLEREAQEGGQDILIPITVDKYIFDEWKPERRDIAAQVKSRVITLVVPETETYEKEVKKIADSLKKNYVWN